LAALAIKAVGKSILIVVVIRMVGMLTSGPFGQMGQADG